MNTRVFVVAGLLLASAGDFFGQSGPRFLSSRLSTAPSLLLLMGLIVFVGGYIVLRTYVQRRRSDRIQAIATKRGMTFRRKATEADKILMAGCGIADVGYGRVVANIVEVAKAGGLRVTLFDYCYCTGSRSPVRHNQTVTRIQIAGALNLPSFKLYPETILDKLGKLFSGADINFPEAPQFSKKYILRGPDEAAIRAVFTPEVLLFFEQRQALTVDAAGDLVFLHRSNRRVKPEELESHISEGTKVLSLFFGAPGARRQAPPSLS